MDQSKAEAIEAAIKEIVDQLAPDAHYVTKYGGEVFSPYPGDDRSFVGGIFVYQNHMSLEFSSGASFDDPKGQLEGRGKMRRHLKLRSLEDVETKNARSFLRQAFAD